MEPLPTLESPERPAERTEQVPASVRPERRSKPATGARKPVQREAPEADELSEDEPANVPQQKPLIVALGELTRLSPLLPTQITRPVPASLPDPITETKSSSLTYELKDNTRGMCHVWINGVNCPIAVDGRYMVKNSGKKTRAHPACFDHYTMIRKTYPERTAYFNQFDQLVTANDGKIPASDVERSPWGLKG